LVGELSKLNGAAVDKAYIENEVAYRAIALKAIEGKRITYRPIKCAANPPQDNWLVLGVIVNLRTSLFVGWTGTRNS
jgi:hypothetical protein